MMKLTPEWNSEQRIAVAVKVLGQIQLDIPAGRYSVPGRPNIETVVGILTCEPELIEASREQIESFLSSVHDNSNLRGQLDDDPFHTIPG